MPDQKPQFVTGRVTVTVDDGIAVLVRNNPPLNLTTVDTTAQLRRHLEELEDDERVRVLVVTGAGRAAFGAGSDITEFPDYVAAGSVLTAKMSAENDTQALLEAFSRPTIAAINGPAYGGGLELALCCDVLVAGESCRLGLPEAKLGLFPGGGGPVRLARRIGEGRAREMLMLGDPVDAHTALAWGLVNRVVSDGEVTATALALAARLAEGATRALQLTKQALALSWDRPAHEAVKASEPLFAEVFATADAAEGVAAFLEKRPPVFRGR
ncbi:MAG: enoyl-CoA hydratase [Mycobacteriales bacterium]